MNVKNVAFKQFDKIKKKELIKITLKTVVLVFIICFVLFLALNFSSYFWLESHKMDINDVLEAEF